MTTRHRSENKRGVIRAFLAILMVGLSGAANSAAPAEPATKKGSEQKPRVFRAGAATSNITPPLGISMEGFIAPGAPAKHVHDELHARCLVLDDGETRIALVIVDSTMITREIFESAKARVQKEIRFPANRILAAATHTHSTPRTSKDSPGELDFEYHAFIAHRIADGIRRAVVNLAPAKIGWGSGRKPEFVFNRRLLMKPAGRAPNPFGETHEKVGTNPRGSGAEIIGPAGPVDPELFILSVQHADGRPLAVLANYGLHYIGVTGAAAISADYFSAFADRLEGLLQANRQDPPFVGLMFNGTSGDVNAVDFMKPGRPQPAYVRINEVADSIAREALRVYQKIEHQTWVPIAMEESELQLAVRRPTPTRLEWAQGVWAATPNKSRLPGRKEIYARETLEVAKLPATVPVKLQAIRIGTLGIAAAPCEIFASTGLEIKAQSPLRQTFTISLANGYNGYLPTPKQHEFGGYETWLSRVSYLEVQASEKIRDELLRLLGRVTTKSP